MLDVERRIDEWSLYFERDHEHPKPTYPGLERPEVDPDWFRHFKYRQYDFDDPEWQRATKRGKSAWRMIPLYKRRPGSRNSRDIVKSGYFMAVSPGDYYRLTHHADGSSKHWTLKIECDPEDSERITKMYARRCGRNGEPRVVYAHREVLNILLEHKYVADHFNGWGLDNRKPNLGCVTRSENGHNTVRKRKKNLGLPVGVEIKHRNGQVRYCGIYAKRFSGMKYATMFRGKRLWKSAARAHLWYENQMKKLHRGRKIWARNPESASYPRFPPQLEHEPSQRSLKLRQKLRERPREGVRVPF